MALELVDQPEGGRVTVNGPKATVTVQGKSPREVNETDAKTLVLQAARGFLARPGISGQSGPYPVDDAGNQIEDLTKGLPAGVQYRQDFTIQEGM
jgi:hypothetical protein